MLCVSNVLAMTDLGALQKVTPVFNAAGRRRAQCGWALIRFELLRLERQQVLSLFDVKKAFEKGQCQCAAGMQGRPVDQIEHRWFPAVMATDMVEERLNSGAG
jgi:hypothetical protein